MKFFKTIIQVEILSEKPLSEEYNLQSLHEMTVSGECSGFYKQVSEQSISKQELIEECVKHQTDPSFFGVDVPNQDEDPV